jgi:hypothetical protein
MSTNRNYGPAGAPGAPSSVINAALTNASPVPATLAGNTTAEQVVLNPALSTTASPVALVVSIPAGAILDKKVFDLVISGAIAAGAAGNVTMKVYSGTSTTPGSDTLLANSGAIAYAGAGGAPFFARLKLIYDSVSGKLGGTVAFLINNTVVAEVAISNVVTGITNTANPILSFAVSFTFSVANAANLVTVTALDVNF